MSRAAESSSGRASRQPGVKKKRSAARRRERDALIHRWLRYGIQLVFFLMAPALFSGAFNGVKYLFTQIGLAQAIEPTAFVIQLVAVLGFTVLFGRFFCGYACAFGTLGDYLFNGFEFLRRRTPLPRPTFPRLLVKALSLVKYVVLAGICVACYAGVWAGVSSSSPWVAFAAILSGSIEGIGAVPMVLLALVALGMVLRERFFCQFLCPLGALFSLMPVLGFSQFTRTRTHCARNCGRCHEVCPVGIWPDADALEHGECVSCGRCVDACPLGNVNLVAIQKRAAVEERRAAETGLQSERPESGEGDKAEKADVARKAARPVRKARDKWLLLRGSEAACVVAKALVLLALCWVVGAARYVPAVSEVFGFSILPF